MKITKDIEIEVMEVHNLFWDSYARRDIDLRFSLCAEDVTFIGSGLHERALNKLEYKKINKEGVKQFPDPFQIEFLWTNITMLSENVACVESEVVWSQMINNEISTELLRNTTLLKYDNNKWLVTHVHGSVPDYRMKEGDYMTNEQTIIRNIELERQVFQRTQDLNKTLEELEQKNRELEIETALEKVRSSALAMKKPEDMLDVCRIISDQLQSLGVNEIRNFQTAIFYETKKTYINFEYYTKHRKSIITEVDYRTHELQELFASKMIRGVEELFSETLKSKEVKDWYAYQKTTNQFADSFLETAESLSYYWYSLGQVALGMSTYIPLNEHEINLFKRFRNVFELAYRRFLDIQQAEAQAREAKIEAALEKVRAVALSLKKSDEMLDIAQALYEQLLELGFTNIRNTIIDLHNDSNETFWDFDYSHDMGKTITLMTYHDDPIIEKQVRQIESSSDAFFELILEGQDLQDLIDMRLRNGEEEDPRLRQIQQLTYNLYSFGNGAIGISNFGLLSDEQKIVLKRFRNVFAFAYKRYNELVLAESQAREAKIEAALEKVRSSALAMKEPEEMVNVCNVISDQLELLGVKDIRNVQTAIINEQKVTYLNYQYFAAYKEGVIEETDFNKHPTVLAMVEEMKKSANSSFSGSMKGTELITFREWRKQNNQFPDLILDEVDSAYYYFYSIGLGGLGLTTYKPLPEEGLDIFKRFHNVFTLAYRRFIDIEKAIAQAKEAMIETSLEKVRAAAMSMNKPEDLLNICEVLFKEFLKLGFGELRNAMINIHNDEKGTFINYDYSDVIGRSINHLTYNIHPVIEKQIKQIRSANDAFSETSFTGKDLEEWKKFRNKIGERDDPRIKNTSALYYYFYSIGTGSIGISTFSPINDEKLELLKRFRNVFSLSYQRYADIALAEAQAKEAKIEASLERVRSKAMAMHSPNDLSETVNVFFKELKTLGIIPIRCGVGQIDDVTRTTSLTTTTSSQQGESFRVIGKVKQTGHPVLDGIFDHWKLQKEYHPVLEGEDIKAYYNVMNAQIGYPEYPEGVTQFGNNFFFKEGFVFAWTENLLSEEELIIFRKFTSVLSLTYRRYLDLEEAEEQAREAKIEASLEKVRAVAMSMNKPDDLLNICEVMFKELQSLRFNELRNTLISTYQDDKDYFDEYDYSDASGGYITKIPYSSHPALERFQKQIWRTTDAFEEFIIVEDQLNDWKEHRRSNGEPDDPRLENISALYYYFYSIGPASIGISTFNSISEEMREVLKRFRNVFSLSYQRYTDIALAETQAREAQIEAALERVRSRTMGMQKSEELKDVIRIVYEQFVHLKINVDHAGFVVDYTPKGDWHFWIADKQEIPSKITHPYFDSIWAHQFDEAKEKGIDFFATNLNFEEKNKFYQDLFKFIPGVPEESLEFYFNCPGLAGSTVLLDSVGLYIENFSGTPYSEEENNTLMRFGKVFQQTYTRFLDLQKAEAQNKIIQAENERKTKELEEARQLQLAMLPKSIPEIPNLDIAVYMKTATEVGGDYYDFKVQENGVLNIGIGDATGHGLQAGTMITLMKGFFTSDVAKFNPKKFLEHCNGMIRDIRLGRILMSFSHLRFENNSLLISSAGMPPIYYYHKKNYRTEEIIIQGLPLGAMGSASYKLVEKEINSGDTILLLTDGLPEQMNSHKVIFDYSRVLKYFDEIAENTPKDIINRLVQKADGWMDGQKQSDDITFVVIKVK